MPVLPHRDCPARLCPVLTAIEEAHYDEFSMSAEIKVNDLRLLAIQTRGEITFRARDGRVGVMSEKGILHIPGLNGPPSYNLDDVLARAEEFTLTGADKKARTLARAEMVALLAARAPARAAAPKEEE